MRQYRFGPFVMDFEQRRLLQGDGEEVVLSPRIFDALQFFVERPGDLLDKDALLAALWPGLIVEENNLSQVISSLRRALGDEAQGSRYVQTVPRRGFRFIAPVTVVDPQPSPEVPDAPQTRRAGDGAEPLPLVPRRRLLLGVTIAGVALVAAGAAAWWWRPWRLAVNDATTTLAVLPFKPLVAEARDEVLEFGMADSLVARLSTLPGVVVRSVGSVRRYAGPEQDPLRAARDLDVAWIVDGSIQRWGDDVRVTARLLNAATGEAAWSGKFDERFTGVFDLQDAISTRVSQVLAPHLGARGRRRLMTAGGTHDIDAYQIYLAARHQAQGIRTAGLVKSIDLYRQAIALDPGFALAYVGLAESHRRMIFGADGEPRVIFEEAKRHVERAIAIDPDLAEAYGSRGWNQFWSDWDWKSAEQTFQQAIALSANEVSARFGYGQLLTTLGRDPEAAAQMAVARELDPQSLILLTLESNSLYRSGKPDEGRAHLQRVFDLEPDFWVAHLTLGSMLLHEKKIDEAIASMERADRNADGSSQAAAALGHALATNGQPDHARVLLARFADLARSRYVPPTSSGLIHAGLGDREATLAALQRGHAARDVRMTIVPYDSRWKLVRDDPRYVAIFRQMGLPNLA